MLVSSGKKKKNKEKPRNSKRKQEATAPTKTFISLDEKRIFLVLDSYMKEVFRENEAFIAVKTQPTLSLDMKRYIKVRLEILMSNTVRNAMAFSQHRGQAIVTLSDLENEWQRILKVPETADQIN